MNTLTKLKINNYGRNLNEQKNQQNKALNGNTASTADWSAKLLFLFILNVFSFILAIRTRSIHFPIMCEFSD